MKILLLVIIFTFNLFIPLISSTYHVVLASQNDLTIQQAISRAVQGNNQIRTIQENAEVSVDNIELRRANVPYGQNITAFINHQAGVMQAVEERATYLRNIQSTRDTLGFLAATQFINILIAEGAFALGEAELELYQNELQILRARISVGHASELEYNLKALSVDALYQNMQTLINQIEHAQVELNRLMSSQTNNRHNLIFDVDYNEMVVLNFNGHLNNHRQNHALVRQAVGTANIARYRYENFFIEFDETGQQLPVAQTREELMLLFNLTSRNIASARDNVVDHIVNTYYRIREIEQNIIIQELQLSDQKREATVLQTRLRVGEILPIDIERHALEILRTEENLRRSKFNHYLLEMQFRNPNIAF